MDFSLLFLLSVKLTTVPGYTRFFIHSILYKFEGIYVITSITKYIFRKWYQKVTILIFHYI